jgi:hypothetical protein
LRERFPLIKAEYEAIAASGVLPNDYDLRDGEAALHKGPHKTTPPFNGGALPTPSSSSAADVSWTWHSYVQKGVRRADFASHCPGTADTLESLESLMAGDAGSSPFGYAFFSVMKPQTSIAPHFGPTNIRLRVHLPLIVPEGGSAGMRVGEEEIAWEEGQPVVFDDSFEHETWNRHPTDTRVILLFDIWHPEISGGERLGISEMFDVARRKGWLS